MVPCLPGKCTPGGFQAVSSFAVGSGGVLCWERGKKCEQLRIIRIYEERFGFTNYSIHANTGAIACQPRFEKNLRKNQHLLIVPKDRPKILSSLIIDSRRIEIL